MASNIHQSLLGGRGRSLMIACCSPAAASTEETLNTLHFASLALRVRSKPVIILVRWCRLTPVFANTE